MVTHTPRRRGRPLWTPVGEGTRYLHGQHERALNDSVRFAHDASREYAHRAYLRTPRGFLLLHGAAGLDDAEWRAAEW